MQTFISVFERSCNTLRISEENRLSILQSNLKEGACDWADSLESPDLTYEDLKSALLVHFRSEMVGKVRQLEELKQGSKTIYDHNLKF